MSAAATRGLRCTRARTAAARSPPGCGAGSPPAGARSPRAAPPSPPGRWRRSAGSPTPTRSGRRPGAGPSPERLLVGIEAHPHLVVELLERAALHARAQARQEPHVVIEALEPALDPAAARLEHDHLEVAEALEHAREYEVRERHHRVDGEAGRGGVADVGEVEAERRPRHVPHRERVEADGDAELGRRLPEGVVAAVAEVAAAVGVRADEDAAKAEPAHAAAPLGARGGNAGHGTGAD